MSEREGRVPSIAPFVEVAETLPHEEQLKLTPPFVVSKDSNVVVIPEAFALPLVVVRTTYVAFMVDSWTLPFVVIRCTELKKADWGTYTCMSTE